MAVAVASPDDVHRLLRGRAGPSHAVHVNLHVHVVGLCPLIEVADLSKQSSMTIGHGLCPRERRLFGRQFLAADVCNGSTTGA